jgi:hypothetical protein
MTRTIRWLPALATGLIVFAVAYTAAASLSVSSTNLAAGNVTVAACDLDGVSAAYDVSWNATAGEYTVDTVNVAGIAAACVDQDFSVTLVDNGGDAIATVDQADVASGQFTGSGDNLGLAFDFSSDGVGAAAVFGIYTSISD